MAPGDRKSLDTASKVGAGRWGIPDFPVLSARGSSRKGTIPLGSVASQATELGSRAVPRLHAQPSLVNRVLPSVLAGGKSAWVEYTNTVTCPSAQECRHPNLSPSTTCIFKPFGVASDQHRPVMVSSCDRCQKTFQREPKGMACWHGASSIPYARAQIPWPPWENIYSLSRCHTVGRPVMTQPGHTGGRHSEQHQATAEGPSLEAPHFYYYPP